MKIGDKKSVIPDFLNNQEKNKQRRIGTVVYIHPERRYFIVEWAGKYGDLVRESFFIDRA